MQNCLLSSSDALNKFSAPKSGSVSLQIAINKRLAAGFEVHPVSKRRRGRVVPRDSAMLCGAPLRRFRRRRPGAHFGVFAHLLYEKFTRLEAGSK